MKLKALTNMNMDDGEVAIKAGEEYEVVCVRHDTNFIAIKSERSTFHEFGIEPDLSRNDSWSAKNIFGLEALVVIKLIGDFGKA